ncbi:MAG: aspartyl protease family protein [Acidobacteriaceae bacterium]|nr:aspartyl protease family protein [Acidobacteriaceae bacterium]
MSALLLAGARAAPPDQAPQSEAIKTFLDGNYKAAIPMLQAAANTSPNDPNLHAALLSALVYEGRVEDASDQAADDEQHFPTSADVITARGEYAFYMADFGTAETLFKQALKIDPDNARAYYGLSRIALAASNFRTGRMLGLVAHQKDSADALITKYFISFMPREKRGPALAEFRQAHPWFYEDAPMYENTESEVSHELNGRKAFELDGEKREVTLKLISIMRTATALQGVGLEFQIEDARPIRLLLDTGASGIMLNQRAVDKAGLDHLGSFKTWGVGDQGKRGAFAAVAEYCQIAELKYKTCILRGGEGKRAIVQDEDGLIGLDFFSGYLIDIDFHKMQLHLKPLPERPFNAQGYDREIPPDEKDFTPVLRFGSHLFIDTNLNGKIWGLFLLDTGASVSNVDSTFAKLSTKLYGNPYLRIHGISGDVKDVFQADKAVLRFAHYQQDNLGLIAFNLNNQPEHEEFRMSGILGFPVLSLFRMSFDYRNGLVRFEYIYGEKKHK